MADSGDVLADPRPADPCLDELLTASDEGQRAEAGDRLTTVELPNGPQSRPEAPHLTGRLAVLEVPLLGVLPESQDQLVDGNDPSNEMAAAWMPRSGPVLTGEKPFGD